ncbi:coagulation factor XIII B chain [Xenopus laevis]|uniref:Sushi domain-containing protein n=2 Tax=Xenopus laevis TaxID=8355 RepID=A0A974C9T9_XENLA|nr:coagulation factor XIII B chain [Xenopus laevis]OCT69310.1 hypothetical protein XELAEV_18040625mg [Xenopus laevis]
MGPVGVLVLILCCIEVGAQVSGPCSLSDEDMEANGIRMGFFFWYRRSTVRHGESVSFRCVQGYGISDSSLLRVKCNNGVIPYPKCTKLESCGPPPVVLYGEILQDRMKSYEHGSLLTYKCPLYYKLEGNQNITCRDGKWDDPPACKEPCKLSEEDMEANGIRRGPFFWFRGSILQHGDSVLFRCVHGYEISQFRLLTVKCNNGVIPYPKCTKLE